MTKSRRSSDGKEAVGFRERVRDRESKRDVESGSCNGYNTFKVPRGEGLECTEARAMATIDADKSTHTTSGSIEEAPRGKPR
jgi:hypothetical protein